MACDVKFYYRANYDYYAGCLAHGDYPNINSSGLPSSPDNSVGSMKLAPHTRITVYEDTNYGGQSRTFSNTSDAELGIADLSDYTCSGCGITSLTDNWNDEISSLKIVNSDTLIAGRCAIGDANVLSSTCKTYCSNPANYDVCNSARAAYCSIGTNIAGGNCYEFYNWAKSSKLNTSDYDQSYYNYCSSSNGYLVNEACRDYIKNNPNNPNRAAFDTLWMNYCSTFAGQRDKACGCILSNQQCPPETDPACKDPVNNAYKTLDIADLECADVYNCTQWCDIRGISVGSSCDQACPYGSGGSGSGGTSKGGKFPIILIILLVVVLAMVIAIIVYVRSRKPEYDEPAYGPEYGPEYDEPAYGPEYNEPAYGPEYDTQPELVPIGAPTEQYYYEPSTLPPEQYYYEQSALPPDQY